MQFLIPTSDLAASLGVAFMTQSKSGWTQLPEHWEDPTEFTSLKLAGMVKKG